MNLQFDNEVTLNDEAIPFSILKKNGKEYFYVYAHGNKRFQCRELRSVMSELDSNLTYSISQRNKKNKAYYGKFMVVFDIDVSETEKKRFYFMKIFFDNEKEREWATWLIPKEYTKRINRITHDFDDRSGV
jgi:hypothetical protein